MTHDPLEQRLRQALDSRAEEVVVSADALDRIRERTAARPAWWRRPVVVLPALAGAAAAAVVTTVLVWPQDPGDGAVTGTPPSPTPTTTATAPPSPTPTQPTPTPTPSPTTVPSTVTLPIYYVGETTQGPRLYREFRAVPATGDPDALSPEERVSLAVQFLLDEPALDPDYGTRWPDGLVVTSVSREEDEVVRLDLAYQEGADFDFDEIGVQQLVHTVTAVLQETVPVELAFNGAARPAESRADPMDVQAFVWISSPQEGDVVGRTFEVSGTAAVFEATLSYEVRRADGTPVTSGFTNTAEGQAFAPYSFTLTLEPGTYVIEAYESSAEDGSKLSVETRTVTVR